MKSIFKHKMLLLAVAVVLIIIFSSVLIIFNPHYSAEIGSDWDKLQFDVKLIRFNTEIAVYKNNDILGTVKGNIFRILTDPLSFYNTNNEKIAYAADTYHIIAQDSHTIIVNNVVTAEMVGKIKLFGEAYDIYDNSGNKIAHANFSPLNLSGKMTDNTGETIAIYRANPILKDFTVSVSPNNPIDDATLIMIFSSYYSDYTADSENNSSNNSD